MNLVPLRLPRRGVLGCALALGCSEAAEPPRDADSDAPSDAPPSCAPPGYTRVGPLRTFAQDRWVFVDPPGVIVGRDPAGLFVYSGVCTHSGCTVPAPDTPGGLSICPCHQSTFSDQGRRLSGPARGDLPHYAAIICQGVLYADTMRDVLPTTRTPIPDESL